MSRQRWFCAVCGGLTNRPPGPSGRAYCAGHADVPRLDAVPPDPLESLPTMVQAWGKTPDDTKDCYTTGLTPELRELAARMAREDLSPATGTED